MNNKYTKIPCTLHWTIHNVDLKQKQKGNFELEWARGSHKGQTDRIPCDDDFKVNYESNFEIPCTMFVHKDDQSIRAKQLKITLKRFVDKSLPKVYGKLTLDLGKYYARQLEMQASNGDQQPQPIKEDIEMETGRSIAPILSSTFNIEQVGKIEIGDVDQNDISYAGGTVDKMKTAIDDWDVTENEFNAKEETSHHSKHSHSGKKKDKSKKKSKKNKDKENAEEKKNDNDNDGEKQDVEDKYYSSGEKLATPNANSNEKEGNKEEIVNDAVKDQNASKEKEEAKETKSENEADADKDKKSEKKKKKKKDKKKSKDKTEEKDKDKTDEKDKDKADEIDKDKTEEKEKTEEKSKDKAEGKSKEKKKKSKDKAEEKEKDAEKEKADNDDTNANKDESDKAESKSDEEKAESKTSDEKKKKKKSRKSKSPKKSKASDEDKASQEVSDVAVAAAASVADDNKEEDNNAKEREVQMQEEQEEKEKAEQEEKEQKEKEEKEKEEKEREEKERLEKEREEKEKKEKEEQAKREKEERHRREEEEEKLEQEKKEKEEKERIEKEKQAKEAKERSQKLQEEQKEEEEEKELQEEEREKKEEEEEEEKDEKDSNLNLNTNSASTSTSASIASSNASVPQAVAVPDDATPQQMIEAVTSKSWSVSNVDRYLTDSDGLPFPPCVFPFYATLLETRCLFDYTDTPEKKNSSVENKRLEVLDYFIECFDDAPLCERCTVQQNMLTCLILVLLSESQKGIEYDQLKGKNILIDNSQYFKMKMGAFIEKSVDNFLNPILQKFEVMINRFITAKFEMDPLLNDFKHVFRTMENQLSFTKGINKMLMALLLSKLEHRMIMKLISNPMRFMFTNAIVWNSFMSALLGDERIDLNTLREVVFVLIMANGIAEDPSLKNDIAPHIDPKVVLYIMKNYHPDIMLPQPIKVDGFVSHFFSCTKEEAFREIETEKVPEVPVMVTIKNYKEDIKDGLDLDRWNKTTVNENMRKNYKWLAKYVKK